MGNDEYNFVDYSYVRKIHRNPHHTCFKNAEIVSCNGAFDFRNNQRRFRFSKHARTGSTLRTYAIALLVARYFRNKQHSEGTRACYVLVLVRSSLYRYVRAPRLASTERRKKPTTDRACETCKRSPSSTMKVGGDDIACASKATMP